MSLHHPLRRSERVVFPNSNGVPLAGIMDLPDQPMQALAVFAHCFTCSKDIKATVRVARALATTGYGVLRFDFTGLGDSEGNFADSSFTTNCADLQAAVDFAAQHWMPASLLIGHSFGGAACLAVANAIDSVKGVATIATPSDTHHLAALLERMNPELLSRPRGEVVIGGRSYTITQAMLSDFRQFDMQAVLAQLSKPVLIFHSPVDETLRFGHALRLLEDLTRPNQNDPTQRTMDRTSMASLISLPGANHLLTNRPTDPTYVAAIIDAWWQQVRMVASAV